MKMPAVHVLSNGLRVVVAPCEAESVAFGLFIASGSRHERPEEAGISHFIEHMLFKGTPTRRAADITRAIEGRGGNFNAVTGEESTCYYVHLPCEYLEEAVDILSDMYLRASVPEDEFMRERQVVIEEIKMYEDDPDSVVFENLQRAIFTRHPLGRPVGGKAETLMKMTPAKLRRYIREHYLPSNTIAVAVGRLDEDKAIEFMERRLGARRVRAGGFDPDRCAKLRFYPPVASISAEKDVQQTQYALGYRTFGVGDRRKYAAVVMDAVLGRGMSSRLFQEVREKRGLSYDISSKMQFFSDAGMFMVSAGLDGSKLGLLRRTVDRELDRIRTRKVPAAELNRIKEFLVGNFRLAHERVTARMFFYGSTLLSFGRLVSTTEQVEGVRSVTSADILEVANAVIDPSRRSESFVRPLAKGV